MNVQHRYDNKYDIGQQATLLFEENEIPLTSREWQQFAELLASSEYDHINRSSRKGAKPAKKNKYHLFLSGLCAFARVFMKLSDVDDYSVNRVTYGLSAC